MVGYCTVFFCCTLARCHTILDDYTKFTGMKFCVWRTSTRAQRRNTNLLQMLHSLPNLLTTYFKGCSTEQQPWHLGLHNWLFLPHQVNAGEDSADSGPEPRLWPLDSFLLVWASVWHLDDPVPFPDRRSFTLIRSGLIPLYNHQYLTWMKVIWPTFAFNRARTLPMRALSIN